jgi:hypothetical protein
LKRPKFDVARRMAGLLMILNQEAAGAISRWRITGAQLEVLLAILDHERTIVLKGRQMGVSTVSLLALLVFAIANPGVPCCIVADTREKAQGLLGRLAGWCDQLGVELGARAKGTLELANAGPDGVATVIDALSAVSRAEAGESRVGRSKSYGFIHASELAFWLSDAAVFRGLTSTALPGARVVVESTASAADNLFRTLWNGDDEDGAGEWHRVFLPIERHPVYQRDPSTIDDAVWALLSGEKYGFTSRATAAWWWHRMRVDFAGDESGALREFPQLPSHCFSFARGRWILRFTEAVTRAVGQWDGKAKRFDGWHYYRDTMPDEPVIVSVDVAAGGGGDSSAVVVLSLLTGTIVATWVSNSTSLPDLVELVKDAASVYSPQTIIVESNGVGIGVYETLHQFSSWHVTEQRSGEEKHFRLQRLKLAIEQGVVPIGPELAVEVKSSNIQPPTGPKGRPSYEGLDDCLNALSFAREFYLGALPPSSSVDPVANLDHSRVIHSSKALRKKHPEKF